MGRLESKLYRLLLRYARSLPDETAIIRSFDKQAWLAKRGAPQFFSRDDAAVVDGVDLLSRTALDKEVRRRFREANGTIEQALDAIKALEEQRYLRERQKSCTTQHVRVCSIPMFVGDDCSLDPFWDDEEEGPVKQYWSYRISITNLSETETVRVVSRHWKIYADDQLVIEVPAGSPGIIGMRPELPPGETFMYYSGTDIESGRKGRMCGSLRVEVQATNDPESFDAIVPEMKFER